MNNIDEINAEILQCLEQDGRMSFAAIAKQVDLTSTAVSQRIQKMMDEGLILGFGVELNRKKLGIQTQAIITLKLNFSQHESFSQIINTYEEVEFCYRVTGEDCMVMKVNLHDNDHLLDFINRISRYGFTRSNIIIDQMV